MSNVNHPKHYNQYPVEVIDMMIMVFGKEKVKDFCLINAFKYRMHIGHKNDPAEDLDKEKWYLDKASKLDMQIQKECKSFKALIDWLDVGEESSPPYQKGKGGIVPGEIKSAAYYPYVISIDTEGHHSVLSWESTEVLFMGSYDECEDYIYKIKNVSKGEGGSNP